MTPEAMELAIAYEGLARALAHKLARRMPPHADRDALCSAALEGLCDAAVKWDPRRGGFKQYASIRIYGSVMDEARRTPGFSRSGRAVALVELGDLTAVEDPGFEMVESVAEQMALWRFLSEAVHRLSARDRLILTLYVFEGVTLATIGEFLGYTESYMSILVKDSLLFCRSFVHHPIHRHRLVGVNS